MTTPADAPRDLLDRRSRIPKGLTASERTAYWSWSGMMYRCLSPTSKDYHKYGARGITVCTRWQTFRGFFADMGPRPAGRSLDRIDNDGNYEPGNCRWATTSEQSNNTRRTVPLTFQGQTHTIREWSRITGMHHNTIRDRLAAGCSVEAALTAPVGSFASVCPRGHTATGRKGQNWRKCPECVKLGSAPLPHKASYGTTIIGRRTANGS